MNKNCLTRFHMSVQVHDNDIEPCLLVVLLILTVCSVLAYSIILGVWEKDLVFHTNHCLHLEIPEGWG